MNPPSVVSYWPFFILVAGSFSRHFHTQDLRQKMEHFVASIIKLTGAAGATCSSSAMMVVEMSVSTTTATRKMDATDEGGRFLIKRLGYASVVGHVRKYVG
jgi:hypothetical protein